MEWKDEDTIAKERVRTFMDKMDRAAKDLKNHPDSAKEAAATALEQFISSFGHIDRKALQERIASTLTIEHGYQPLIYKTVFDELLQRNISEDLRKNILLITEAVTSKRPFIKGVVGKTEQLTRFKTA